MEKLILSLLKKIKPARHEIHTLDDWLHYGKDLLFEIMRYSITGIINTSIYALSGIFFHRVLNLDALNANFCALLVSFVSGFLGHNFFTYRQKRIVLIVIIKFILLQLLALSVSQIIVLAVVEWLGYAYEWAIVASIAVMPPLCWGVGHLWVFQGEKRPHKKYKKHATKSFEDIS